MSTDRWTVRVTPDARARGDQVVVSDEFGIVVASYPTIADALIVDLSISRFVLGVDHLGIIALCWRAVNG